MFKSAFRESQWVLFLVRSFYVSYVIIIIKHFEYYYNTHAVAILYDRFVIIRMYVHMFGNKVLGDDKTLDVVQYYHFSLTRV